jgi:putative transposase
MERWVQTCRRELLDRTLVWNQAHLLHATAPVRAVLQRPPAASGNLGCPEPGATTRLHIGRHDRLGEILHEYRHAA